MFSHTEFLTSIPFSSISFKDFSYPLSSRSSPLTQLQKSERPFSRGTVTSKFKSFFALFISATLCAISPILKSPVTDILLLLPYVFLRKSAMVLTLVPTPLPKLIISPLLFSFSRDAMTPRAVSFTLIKSLLSFPSSNILTSLSSNNKELNIERIPVYGFLRDCPIPYTF